MPRQLDPGLHDLLQRRLIATLGTENADGSIHLTAVWFLFEENSFYIATSSKTKKARNVLAKQKPH
jgi:general stress protein 26